jgi:protein TonB
MKALLASLGLHVLAAYVLVGLLSASRPEAPEPPAQVALVFAPRTASASIAAPASVIAPASPLPVAVPMPMPRPALVLSRSAVAPSAAESVRPVTPPGFDLLDPGPEVVAQPEPGNQPPHFPQSAMARHEHGTVSLRIHVAPDGAVQRVETRRGSGFADLDEAARDSVLHWRFIPTRRDGVAVRSACDLNFAFVME